MADLGAFDRQTGEVVEMPGASQISALRERVQDLEEERVRLKEKLDIELEEKRRLNRRLTNLTKERNSSKSLSPHFEAAERIFEEWRRLLSPTAREFKGKRLENTLDRLEAGQPEELLLQAVRGMAKYPYVTDEGRSEQGQKTERHHDLEIIMREEKTVHRFASYVEDGEKTATISENFSTDLVENVSTPTLVLEPPEVFVPQWPVECARHENPCDHRKMLRGSWFVWRSAGMSGCPGCGQDVIAADGQRSEPWEMHQRTLRRQSGQEQ